MAEAQLQQFLEKVRQLNAFVALSEADPQVREHLCDCTHHNEVVNLARSHGFEIGRRWGEAKPPDQSSNAERDGDGNGNGDGNGDGNGNLLLGPCPRAGQESITVLLEQPGLRLERIHSCQSSSPDDFWYNQSEHEWVVLLQGSAQLQFADEEVPRLLSQGDCLRISAGRRHRVVSTDPAPGCVWLALFWSAADAY